MMTKQLANLTQVRLVLNRKGDKCLASPPVCCREYLTGGFRGRTVHESDDYPGREERLQRKAYTGLQGE
jgi:hypothetical protein